MTSKEKIHHPNSIIPTQSSLSARSHPPISTKHIIQKTSLVPPSVGEGNLSFPDFLPPSPTANKEEPRLIKTSFIPVRYYQVHCPSRRFHSLPIMQRTIGWMLLLSNGGTLKWGREEDEKLLLLLFAGEESMQKFIDISDLGLVIMGEKY
ncbi:hypothetical protein NPIL_555911 [Nephila pilipes]|uniref:Uncharacterized protein n=1 Tax=Nephila pilipes TaxID=299642 RepID=A0A8X6SZK4_NEPPI|nr:hypothetical protein NPIL_555911 [Nephila pilipes]